MSTECTAAWPNWTTMRSMKDVWDNEISLAVRSTLIPRANLIGTRSEISHWDRSWLWKWVFSSGGFVMEKMSSTCMAKITVPIVMWQMYTHHSHGTLWNPHPSTAW